MEFMAEPARDLEGVVEAARGGLREKIDTQAQTNLPVDNPNLKQTTNLLVHHQDKTRPFPFHQKDP